MRKAQHLLPISNPTFCIQSASPPACVKNTAADLPPNFPSEKAFTCYQGETAVRGRKPASRAINELITTNTNPTSSNLKAVVLLIYFEV